jgi:enoyl-CoA hydratase
LDFQLSAAKPSRDGQVGYASPPGEMWERSPSVPPQTAGPELTTVRYGVAETGVATITLDQPETRNALSDQVLDDLIAAFEAARGDEAVRCVVLTSSHERVFSSGGNLSGFAGEVPLVQKHLGSERFVRLFRLIGELGKPSICAANGHVLAGALGLALACDLIVAKETATFGTPEINVGVFPFMIMALIYRNVSRKKTNELLLLGERLSAREAQEAGIVNRVSTPDEFERAVDGWATKLAAKSPVLMRLGKDAMFRQQDMAFHDALEFLHAQLTIALSTEDIVEGVTAFFEKREPVWRGR